MKDVLSRSYHSDPQVFRVNELADHAYFIPFASKDQTKKSRENSPYFHSLCGDWQFLWRPSLYDMEDFTADGFPLSGFDTVTVPECWQAHGKDYTQYQSSPYPFLNDPPHVPQKNPCAAYVKDFDISIEQGKRYELHFEGKDSCIYVWMNGQFVGYGEVPHNDSAFDVTNYLKEGSNRLCVLVLKWCTGTYLDDQDKIRLSGLFREVYLLKRAERGVTDFTLLANAKGELTLSVKAKAPVSAQIYDKDRLLAECSVDGTWHWKVDEPVLWSAECPHLYDLILCCEGEYIRHRFGFRDSTVENGVYKVNGHPVKLYGVNRHDSHPDKGYVTDLEFMRQELMLMKQHNVNAIRTSHYPNDPRFYQLCDEFGFYVLSEADLEYHGMYYVEDKDYFSERPEWAGALHDRIDRMYQTFKNQTCIVIWSLGNESGYGTNLKNENAYLRAVDSSRPIHFESATRTFHRCKDEETKKELNETFGFCSYMYPTLERCEALLTSETLHIPLLLCEYSHAMGNSCGDLRFYDELIQKYDNFAGGFIWEWCDHAMRLQDKSGTSYFGYGGDFGEKHHLRNVCMDGLVTPDRIPHSNLLEAKAVFAPIRITRNENGMLVIQNRHAFSDLSRYVITQRVVADKAILQETTLTADPAPGECVTLPLSLCEPYDARNAALVISVALKADTPWAKAGHEVASFSFPLKAVRQEQPRAFAAPVLTETATSYIVSGSTFCYTFRKDEGMPRLCFKGRELLRKPITLNCFRAPTDNDHMSASAGPATATSWACHRNFGNIEYPQSELRNLIAKTENDRVILSADLVFGVQGRKTIVKGKIDYQIDGSGRISVRQRGAFNEALPYFLPRYGYVLSLTDVADEIKYYGYGPAECYEDKISHALLGEHDYLCDDAVGAWEKPQERGSHCHTQWLKLQCGDVTLHITSDDFSFCATRYDIHETATVPHKKDLQMMDHTDLYLDYRMSGVGSNSCGGQAPVQACRINGGESFDFTFEIQPI